MPEIEQLDDGLPGFVGLPDHDVLGFEIAMYDAHRVGRVEHAHDRREDVQRFAPQKIAHES